MQLELKEESWKNIIEVIHNNDIKSKGNFWASIQSLQNQIERLNVITIKDEEFDLSKKEQIIRTSPEEGFVLENHVYFKNDVKEFIRLLKDGEDELVPVSKINKLAGSKLTP